MRVCLHSLEYEMLLAEVSAGRSYKDIKNFVKMITDEIHLSGPGMTFCMYLTYFYNQHCKEISIV